MSLSLCSLVRHEACGKYIKPSGWKSHTSQDADQLEAVVIVLEETRVQKLMTSGFISCTSKASLHCW